ncbi:hypothetical protein [uncultured Aquimarina sp.]|uniref:hypothetical protein n=1 Tax=uncultured Aquimarina sp. TaxID=575652 RepID=UPI00263671B2|nr:hypothetical protein [uncultured Aquimarina sp.]
MSHGNLLYTWIIGCLLILPFNLFSQELYTYSGKFELGSYKGDANFSYNIIENDTVLNGVFQFSSASLKDLLENKDSSFSITGNFENDYATGPWKFSFNLFETESKSSVEDLQYVVNVSGEQRLAQGNLIQGKPDGTWIYTAQEIQDSKVDKVTFKSTIDFDNGIPQRSFRIEDEEKELVGRFLRNGIAHDQWTLYSDQEIDDAESWFFSEGILERIQITSRGQTTNIEIYPNTNITGKTITLDNTYLEILKLKLGADNASKITDSGILSLLQKNDLYYQEIDTIVSGISKAPFTPQFKVRIPYFPLNNKETKSLDLIADYYKKANAICVSLIEDTQISILKLSDEQVFKLDEEVHLISNKIVKPLGQVLEYNNKSLLPFFSRSEIINKVWERGLPSLNSQNTPIVSQIESSKARTILEVEQLAKESFTYLSTVEEILAKKVNRQRREQKAIDLEKKMISQLQYLEVLEKSFETDTIPEAYINTLSTIKSNARSKLNRYASMEDLEEKLKYAEELVVCFDALDNIGETILKLPNQQNEIKKKYQDDVWNPFTSTVMTEMVKKRITQAYENVLIPYFLEKVEQDISCDDSIKWIQTVHKTHQRMHEMREENTRKLERKLRKEKDPLIILERFQVYPINKEKE